MTPALTIAPSKPRIGIGLIHLKGAAFLRGEQVRVIRRLVDGGSRLGRHDPRERGFEWVWNFAVNLRAKESCLRLWSQEVMQPQSTFGLTLPSVIDRLLPPARTNFPVGEVCKIFLISYDHLRKLKKAKQLPAGGLTTRAALEKFLIQRLLK